jgi:hypothetical protein
VQVVRNRRTQDDAPRHELSPACTALLDLIAELLFVLLIESDAGAGVVKALEQQCLEVIVHELLLGTGSKHSFGIFLNGGVPSLGGTLLEALRQIMGQVEA